METQNDSSFAEQKLTCVEKNTLPGRYKLAAVFLLLFIIPVFVFILLRINSGYDPDSEAEIRQAAATIGQDPNKLSNKDFAKINTLILNAKNLSKLKLLEKFTNLKILVLDFSSSFALPDYTPKWKLFLIKMGFIKIQKQSIYTPPWVRKKFTIDIRPLGKLKNLEKLSINNIKIENAKPLARLSNLRELSLIANEISDIESLSKLKNLQTLNLIDNNVIIDLKPLTKLTNLKTLNCSIVRKEQIDDLQKTLPDLKITIKTTISFDVESIGSSSDK